MIEADEYDTAFFDKRSKFVHYRPRTPILNNLEYDHADIFPDLAAIETQFHHLVRTVPATGRIVVNAGEASLRGCSRAAAGARSSASGWRKLPAQTRGWTIAVDGAIRLGAAPQGTLALDQAGRHNQLNALAAIAAARHAGVPVAASLAALARFRGVRRRMEVRGVVNGVTVYDDFAHHPTAIAVTLDGLRQQGRRRAHPGGARAALEHDEARRNEGRAARQPRRRRPRVLLRGEPRLGRGRGAGAAGGEGDGVRRSRRAGRGNRRRGAGRAITCW